MNGIILVDKPQDFTSFDVVAKMRGILKTKSVGHGGTLDPMATGVLPVFVGRATKCCDILPCSDKTYVAGLKLGITTDTQDITGSILKESQVNITKEIFQKTVNSFVGEIEQIPPMYSAVKQDGKKLYELARKGITVERKPRKITIYKINILSEDYENNEFLLEVSCSKGTYIRTLCEDIGNALGCGGVLFSLRRTEAAGFKIENCHTLEEISKLKEAGDESFLIPASEAFKSLKKVTLSKKHSDGFINGVKYSLDSPELKHLLAGERVAVYGFDDSFLGVADCDGEKRVLRIVKLFKINETNNLGK